MKIYLILKRLLPHREMGWTEIGEQFTRFTLLSTRWGNIFLHRLVSPNPHPQCHDHPWSFVAILLRGGYDEYLNGQWTWRRPGSVLWRPAETKHNVITRSNRVSWSIILTGRKYREWAFVEECR